MRLYGNQLACRGKRRFRASSIRAVFQFHVQSFVPFELCKPLGRLSSGVPGRSWASRPQRQRGLSALIALPNPMDIPHCLR